LISYTSAQCSVCQLVVSFTEKWVQNNATEAEILSYLDNLCADLPVLGAQCTSVVNQYAPQLIAYVVNKENPQTFCSQVGLCSNQLVQSAQSQKREEEQSVCPICQLVMSSIEAWLAQNATEQEIIAQLDVLCAALGPLSSSCDSLVSTYAPEMIQWVEKNENPAAFCAQVGLCTNSTHAEQVKLRNKREESEETEEAQSALCQICQVVVSYVDQFLQQNNTVSEIETELDNFCNALPSPLSGFCTSMVSSYLPQMIQWIVKKEAPAAFCGQVDLCSSARVNKKL